MNSKNVGLNEYGLIPSEDEPFEQHKGPIVDVEYAPATAEKRRKKNKGKFFSKRTFCICFSDIKIASSLLNAKAKDEQRKDKFLFTNVEAELPDKVPSALKGMRSKSCFLICCSTVEVDKGKEQEH